MLLKNLVYEDFDATYELSYNKANYLNTFLHTPPNYTPYFCYQFHQFEPPNT